MPQIWMAITDMTAAATVGSMLSLTEGAYYLFQMVVAPQVQFGNVALHVR